MIANQTQVGGTHYKSMFQHWDLCHLLDLGYFEGQITKYVTRHRVKKGLEDLQKARHNTVKLIELARSMGRMPRHMYPTKELLLDYGDANSLTPLERMCILKTTTWIKPQDLHLLLDAIEQLIEECYPDNDGEPGPGYVNQG